MSLFLCADTQFRVTFLNGTKPNTTSEFKVFVTPGHYEYGFDVPVSAVTEIVDVRNLKNVFKL
jgi:hypothetical protein